MEPSDRDDTAGRIHSDSSSAASPTDTRSRPRYEPISGTRDDDGLSESFQSTDTIRRRPDVGYGTVQSPTPTATASSPSPFFGESASSTQPRPSPYPSVGRSPLLGPERGRARPRKPPMARRASSNAQAPHRGEVFSVDDALSEIAAEQAERQNTMRRRAAAPTPSLKAHSTRDGIAEEEDEDVPRMTGSVHLEPDEEAALREEDAEEGNEEGDAAPLDENGDDGDHDDDRSDAESFTLKDRQQAINETHPFGIRLWKPALYKKDRSVQKTAEGDIHSSPGGRVSRWLLFFDIIWTLCFGWWMALVAFLGALACFLFAAAPSGRDYGRVLWGLSGYLFYPFGKFVRLEQQEPYVEEDQGEGRSISEYEQWQSGDLEYGRLFFGPDRNRSIIGRSRRSVDSMEPSETDSLLGRRTSRRDQGSDGGLPRMKRRLFGRGQWNVGRVIFFLFFYLLITPSLFIVSGICWLLVFWIPMGKVTMLLFDHLRRHPLAMSFESDISSARAPTAPHSSIIVCTYRAVGLKYWKYTIDGTNIFLINLMAVVMLVIFDWIVLDGVLHLKIFLTTSAFLFVAALLSIIPLAYFIGQAVASISAQSSMGLGAALNAFFSTIVEVFLYIIALNQGKAQLVEGSIIGSIFAGILFLPGLSMCFGAIKRKTQRFNARSAGVTSTMLLFAVIGAFGPTLFYQIYGTHELNCLDCVNYGNPGNPGNPRHGSSRDCRRCYFSQTPAIDDRFYQEAVRPYSYVAASMLFLSYVIGLWFTLRTHAAVIWNTELEKHEEHMAPTMAPQQTPRSNLPSIGEVPGADIRDSHLYRRILGQSLRQVGLQTQESMAATTATADTASSSGPGNGSATPHVVPPKTGATDSVRSAMHIPGFTEAENNNLVQQVAEMAATAVTLAARDARTRGASAQGVQPSAAHRPTPIRAATFHDHEEVETAVAGHAAGGGHDAPNWSRRKSAIILMGATVLYAIIAEILVDSVDFVLEDFSIDEKFLGITLFALVPNTTEFLNAISFAMNGNIALSMEIGSAYALQVCLLQIPALVLFSAYYPLTPPGADAAHYTFALLFPQWDMVTIILCVFLLSYMYGEGKSNYFKGSILLLSYLVVVVGYYFSGYTVSLDSLDGGMRRFDTVGVDGQLGYGASFKTVGRSTRGLAF